MSGVSFPVNRPVGRALVVGSASNRAQPIAVLRGMYGFDCAEADDPYSAMLELCRRKVVYNTVILSLASLYREELAAIASIKRRFPHLEIWLTHTDGRAAALAEAMRLGADGLLGDDGLHRIAPAPTAQPSSFSGVGEDLETMPEPTADFGGADDARPPEEPAVGEPVLTADELRALLQDQPSMPPSAPQHEP